MNQTNIIGRLGRDPETKTFNERSVCNFSVAVDDGYTKDGERVDRTTWYRVAAWRGLGETCQRFLSKGRQVRVTGRVEASAYMKEGEPVASLELIAQEVEFLGSKNDSAPSEAPDPNYQASGEDDSIPF